MYANHITTDEHGPMTVELHIETAERRALPAAADRALFERGTLMHPAVIDETTTNEVWHLAHADALAIEEIIDEAADEEPADVREAVRASHAASVAEAAATEPDEREPDTMPPAGGGRYDVDDARLNVYRVRPNGYNFVSYYDAGAGVYLAWSETHAERLHIISQDNRRTLAEIPTEARRPVEAAAEIRHLINTPGKPYGQAADLWTAGEDTPEHELAELLRRVELAELADYRDRTHEGSDTREAADAMLERAERSHPADAGAPEAVARGAAIYNADEVARREAQAGRLF